jgi:hypothetical protein
MAERHARTAGFLYRRAYAPVRDRLGWEWGPVTNGTAQLTHIAPELLSEFARRRREITAAAELIIADHEALHRPLSDDDVRAAMLSGDPVARAMQQERALCDIGHAPISPLRGHEGRAPTALDEAGLRNSPPIGLEPADRLHRDADVEDRRARRRSSRFKAAG